MKIFGIGMPRTGTTSLSAALQMLGYSSLHFAHDPVTVQELRAGNYRLSVLDHYDALTNIPAPSIYAQLDLAFPGSKFILTVREETAWLASCERAWFNQSDAIPEPGSMREFYRTLLYGCSRYNEDRFRWVARGHAKLVLDHFSAAKADQLLVMDIAAGDGWNKLCPFLGASRPDFAFPHANQGAGVERAG